MDHRYRKEREKNLAGSRALVLKPRVFENPKSDIIRDLRHDGVSERRQPFRAVAHSSVQFGGKPINQLVKRGFKRRREVGAFPEDVWPVGIVWPWGELPESFWTCLPR
jgi:hypothetical protein